MRKGFSMVEVLVVIGIMVLLLVAGIYFYSNWQQSAQLNENANGIIQALRTARVYSVSEYNNSPYGVYFLVASTPNQYILYQGASYASRNASYDRITTLGSALSASSANLIYTNSNIDINFALGTGMPSNVGVLTIRHSTGGSRLININQYGLIELQ